MLRFALHDNFVQHDKADLEMAMKGLISIMVFLSLATNAPADDVTISVDDLADKIRGGLLAQIIGNLNGLPHEMKYIDEPGKVESYSPSLPEGARTDDDTD